MCYEAGHKRADLLVNLSNDGWFSTHQGDRKLHAQIARFRCIENRVPMVRCVNTGLSLSIDSCGRVVGAVGQGRYGTSQQAGALYAQPRLDARQTLYGRIGDVFPVACLIVTILLLGWTYLPGSRTSST
jgi:apolipoprotein N-acyltransferase